MPAPVSFNDAYGPQLDTGIGTQQAVRTNAVVGVTWQEFHAQTEVDTGSTLKLSTGTTLQAAGLPHFTNWQPASSPH